MSSAANLVFGANKDFVFSIIENEVKKFLFFLNCSETLCSENFFIKISKPVLMITKAVKVVRIVLKKKYFLNMLCKEKFKITNELNVEKLFFTLRSTEIYLILWLYL